MHVLPASVHIQKVLNHFCEKKIQTIQKDERKKTQAKEKQQQQEAVTTAMTSAPSEQQQEIET